MAPSTLNNYIDCLSNFERFVGDPLESLLPLEEGVLIKFLTHLRSQNYKASTLNSHVSALGTISEWLGLKRPKTSTVEYILRGEAKEDVGAGAP